jgi:hypothetical protein
MKGSTKTRAPDRPPRVTRDANALLGEEEPTSEATPFPPSFELRGHGSEASHSSKREERAFLSGDDCFPHNGARPAFASAHRVTDMGSSSEVPLLQLAPGMRPLQCLHSPFQSRTRHEAPAQSRPVIACSGAFQACGSRSAPFQQHAVADKKLPVLVGSRANGTAAHCRVSQLPRALGYYLVESAALVALELS